MRETTYQNNAKHGYFLRSGALRLIDETENVTLKDLLESMNLKVFMKIIHIHC